MINLVWRNRTRRIVTAEGLTGASTYCAANRQPNPSQVPRVEKRYVGFCNTMHEGAGGGLAAIGSIFALRGDSYLLLIMLL